MIDELERRLSSLENYIINSFKTIYEQEEIIRELVNKEE